MTTTPTAAARVSGTIKALEWETNFAAPDIPHSYATHGDDEDGWQISVCWRTCSEWLNDGQLFATEAAAKAAAQADYDARILAAIQPDPEPEAVIEDADMKRCAGCGSVRDRRGMDCLDDGSWRCVDCTPSSAGTVSVEAAAKVIVDAWDADTLPVNEPAPMLPAFIAALRALAGEGGR